MRAVMSLPRQDQRKAAALAALAAKHDLAAEQLGELLAQVQPEPGAFGRIGAGAADAAEGAEELVLLDQRNADAGVVDPDLHGALVRLRARQQSQPDAATAGELDGVASQIEDDLP